MVCQNSSESASIFNSFNDLQPLKALLRILLTEEGIVNSIKDKQPGKALFPIVTTEEVIIKLFNEVQPMKVLILNSHLIIIIINDFVSIVKTEFSKS